MMKQSKPATPDQPVTRTREPSTQVCPYCHKLLDEENGLCRLTHEHGQFGMPREHHPLYSELEDEIIRLRQALLDVINVASDREAFVRLGPRGFARAVQIAEAALGPRTKE
jgi:hypothetical protein